MYTENSNKWDIIARPTKKYFDFFIHLQYGQKQKTKKLAMTYTRDTIHKRILLYVRSEVEV